MAHARVFPVDEHHSTGDAQQVRRKQVVVARAGLAQWQGGGDPR